MLFGKAFRLNSFFRVYLENHNSIPLGLMLLMVLLWFGLYAFGRAGRSKGKPQMQELHDFMMSKVKQSPHRPNTSTSLSSKGRS
jgi:hypothetical protein